VNIIDALVVTLGLDTEDFVSRRKDAETGVKQLSAVATKASKEKQDAAIKAKRAATDAEKQEREHEKKLRESIRSVRNEVVALFATMGAAIGFKTFLADTINSQAQLGRLGVNLGLSARRLEAWGVVATEMGGSATDAFGALQAVAGGLAEASIKGHSALTDLANANGVALKDAKGNVLSAEDALISISARMRQLPRQQALWLANQLGVGSMFNQLEQGPDVLRKQLDAAYGLSRVTDASVASAQRLQAQWALIQQRFKETGELVFTKLAPILEKLALRFADFLDSVDWDSVIKKLGNLVETVGNVIKAFGGWQTVAYGLGAILTLKVLSPVLALVSGLIRLIPLLASSTAGLTGLAVAGSAIVGWKIGSFVSDQLAGTKAGDWLGRFEGHVMAGLGNNKAWTAEQEDEWGNLSPANRKQMALMYNSMTAGDKATYDKKNPRFAQLIQKEIQTETRTEKAPAPGAPALNSTPSGTAGPTSPPTALDAAAHLGFGNVNPQHSQIFASNEELFSALETKFKLPEGLLAGVFQKESAGGKHLISPAGAEGPFQMMPKTAASLGLRGDEVMDLDHSAAAAAKYFAQLLAQFHGDRQKAVAAYNWGSGNVEKYGLANAPKETRDYIKAVGGSAQSVAAASSTTTSSSTRTSQIHIGKIEVSTKATNAEELASDLPRALSRNSLIAQVDSGMN